MSPSQLIENRNAGGSGLDQFSFRRLESFGRSNSSLKQSATFWVFRDLQKIEKLVSVRAKKPQKTLPGKPF
jgi:hypothetical protein